MGKITKLYQTRRILAMILAVTMVVGMIPSTALAAPGSDGAQTVENDTAVQATEGMEEDLSSDATTSDDDNTVAGMEEIVTGADDTAADTGDTITGDDNTTANTGENASGSNAAADADNTPSAADEPAPRAEKPVYEIVTDDLETKAVYTGYSVFDLGSVQLKKTENGSSETEPALDAGVTYAWKVQGTDESYTAMAVGAEPINAGTYELTLSYPAVTDVHDGAEKKVICEIAKAPVEILVGDYQDGRIMVAPGTLKETVKPVVARVNSAQNAIDPDELVLTVDGVRDAITGTEVKDGTKLKKNGDYVMDITPDFKADAAADRKAVYANYELESFTADIVVTDLINTIVEVKLTDKWKPDEETEATTVTAKVYDGKPAEAPKLTDDYTYVVKYYDAASDGDVELKDQDGKAAPVTGEWATYPGCELDQDGKVMPPTEAGSYTYYVVYAGEEGIYTESRGEIDVEIEPAMLTVEATNKESLKVLEGTTAQEVLSKITYKVTKVTNKDGKETTEDVTKTMKAGSVWGTGFDDSNVSQIYEPLFTLQESEDGSSWKNIEDEDYREPYTLAADKKYRVIYDGKKAIYNADGTYSHRTDVNDDSNINGVDYNYETDTTPTVAEKAIAVEVTPGAEVEIDITKLLGDKKGALTIADLTAKTYDGKPIYSARSEYKNVVGVKPKEGNDTIKTLLREFTYTWEQYGSADDLLDAQIQEENQTNGFESWGPTDEYRWGEMNSTVISPQEAGVYKLTITYEDQYNDGKLYYAKEPAVVYYAIDPVQVKIVPKGEYKELEGHNGYDLLRKKHDGSTYELQATDGSKTSPIVSGDFVEPKWEIIETRQQEAPAEPSVSTYDYDSCWYFNFERNDKVSYVLQGSDLGQFYYYEDEDGIYYDFYSDTNYTCYSSEKIEIGDANASGKKEVKRKDTFLNETAPITVNPMGTKKLTIEVNADKWGTKEKVYDAKPFTLDELLKGGVVTVKDEDGKEITGKELSDLGIRYGGCVSGEGYDEDLEWITNVGEYTLYAFFYGNETYAPLKSPENSSEDWNPDDWGVKIGTFKITQRTISLKAALPETYTAGVTAREVLKAIPGNVTVEGYAPDDAGAFTEYSEWDEEYEENYYYMWAWSDEESGLQDPSFRIYEKGAKTPVYNNTTLTRDKVYEVRYDAENSSLTQFYNWSTGECSYVISTAAVAEFTVVKGNSTIESIDWGGIESLVTRVKNDDKDSMKRTVTMLEGIGFSSVTLEDGAELEGNLAAFRITPPAEYRGSMPSTAMYKNAITAENVNGYIVDDYGYSFTVIFDAREGTKTFPIRWEDGYIETYTLNFNDAVKLGDLNNAAAPKSLAFNAPDKKMAVGASQQLDVKITKAQMGDVICLGYKSSDEKVLTVNQNGYVTALKIGKANITVFPQHYVKGELEPIPGAKEATVTITTTKVTAPKTVKVTAHGSAGAYANINYDTPKDGYRREIYVVDNSNNSSVKKAADFEKLLAGTGEDFWKENKWQGTFAIAPIYLDSADEALNLRRNNYTVQLSGLVTKGAYTVYVRNVCAARTLADGSVITNEAVNESAAGTAVSFKTLKSELINLKFELDDQAEGVTDLYYSGDEVWDDGEYREIDGTYRIELAKIAKGTVNSATYGLFYTMPKDEAANGNDKEWIALPLKEKLDKDSYENPKLEYTLKDCWNKKTQRREYGSKNDIASIDKKGKIKITGMTGEDQSLIVRVRDTQTGKRTYIALYIVAEADSVMAVKKSVSLSVGQTQYLGSLLAYKMGKQKLTSYPYADIDINAVKAAIKEQKQEQFFKLDQYNNLQAIAKCGSLKLDLTDRNVANSFGKDKATATVTFKSTDLAPVKKVKAVDVINDRFDLTFTYTGGADAFLVEIADANKTIYSKKFARFDVAEYSETGLWANGEYDSKGNRVKDTYRISFDDINIRLSKETQYTVKITALYDALAAKPATAKVKTTKIPAVGGYIDDEHRGGMSIQVGEYNGGRELSEENGTTLSILSGNSYTLTANVEYNRGRVNDTLVWTVNNAKVATVKAAAGSYCITLKGVKPGSTVLEVKSKIWGNKVVARYDINVVAVGDAYKNTNRYYGDDEPAGSTSPSISNGGNNAPEYLPLSVGDPRKVTANQQEYFSFTAPVTGRYTMSADGDVGGRIYLQKTSYPTASNYGSGDVNIGWLQAGETVILTSRVSGAYYNDPGAISYYVEVRLAQSVETVSAGQTIEGTNAQGIFKVSVPEDGRYQFSIVDEYGSTQYLYLYNDENAAIKGGSSAGSGSTIEYDMTKGEENSVWLKTEGTLYSGNKYTIRAEKISEDIDLATPANVTVAARGKKYLMLTVAEGGFYEFSSQADSPSSDIRVTLQVNGVTKDNKYDSEFTFKQELQAGDQVCLVIQNTDYSNDYTFTVKAEEVEIADLTTATSINAVEGGIWQFTATEAGMYEFSASESGAEVYLYENAADAFISKNSIGSGNAAEKEMKAGDTIWLSVELNGATNCQLSAKKISQDLDLTNGSAVTVGAGKNAYVTFSVPQDGYYRIASADGTTSNSDISVELVINNDDENPYYGWDADFEFKKDLKQEDLVRLKISNGDTSDYTFTVKAEEIIAEEMPGDKIQLAAGSTDKAYKFTANEAGLYLFQMESAEASTSLYIYSSMADLDNGRNELGSADAQADSEDSSKQICSIEILLDAGQIVYINPQNTSSSDNIDVTISGDKKEISTLTVGSAQTISVTTSQLTQVTFTASTAGIYTFKVDNVTDDVTLNAYTAYGTGTNSQSSYKKELSSYNNTMEQPLVLAANQTIVWTIEATSTDQSIEMNVESTQELKEIKVGDTLLATCMGTDQASQATADGFVFRAPETGTYTFWSEANDESSNDTYGYLFNFNQVAPDTCLYNVGTNESPCLSKEDGNGPSAGGHHFAIKYNLVAGQTVYLKVIEYYSSNSGTFNVCVAAGEKSF